MSDSNNFNPDTFILDTQSKLTNESDADAQRKINQRFREAKLTDLEGRQKLRLYVAISVGLILLIQFIAAFFFIRWAFYQNNIVQLQWLFTGFFGALCLETYFLARLIVQWLFREIPYKPD